MKIHSWLALCILLQISLSVNAQKLFGQNATDLSCFDVAIVPVQDQCLFVRGHCASSSYQIGRVDYLKLYYCTSFRGTFLALISCGVLLCFVSLAVTASDYLCPNLYSISKFLQLSDNLAGLTLLALGNGAPDVLSTYKALEVEATGLAVSELLGAALFILTVVVGAISWAHPFKVPKFHFIRDIVFYLAISFICLLILVMGSLTHWSSVLLTSTYIVYVAVVLFSHSILWENVVHRVNVSRLRNAYDEESMSEDIDNRIDYFTTDHVSRPSIDSLMSSEYQGERDQLEAFLNTHPHNGTDERVLLETGSYGLRLLLKKLSTHGLDFPSSSSALTLTDERHLTATGSPEALEIPDINDVGRTATAPDQHDAKSLGKCHWKSLIPQIDSGASVFAKAYSIMTFPANTFLRFTTPNREQAIEYGHSISYNAFNFNTSANDNSLDLTSPEYDYKTDMKVFRIQFVAFPVFITFYSLHNTALIWVILPLVLMFFCGISLLIPEGNSEMKSYPLAHRVWNHIGSLIGFFSSLLWISIFAAEIVAVLKAMSVMFSISDDVLGATVFALGNSVGDLVSNLIIAKMGMPVMAFGACFGGPLLSISSLGISATIVMYNKGTQQIPLEFSAPLKWNCSALITTLIFLALCVPLNGWMFDKKIGGILVVIWLASSVLTIASGL